MSPRTICGGPFFRTCGGKAAKSLLDKQKTKLLKRVVGPILDYHNNRWPVTPNLFLRLIVYREK